MKKIYLSLILAAASLTLGDCESETEIPGDNEETTEDSLEHDEWEVAYAFDYDDIAEWNPMITPSGEIDEGKVIDLSDEGEYVTIQAGESGFGGLQTPALEVDMTRNPMLLTRVHESDDAFQWGSKVILSDLVGEDWGLYLINDNNMKWNHYAGARIDEAIGPIYNDYGDILDLHFWFYPTGGEEATVQLTSVYIVYLD